jgi:hypothetical protein
VADTEIGLMTSILGQKQRKKKGNLQFMTSLSIRPRSGGRAGLLSRVSAIRNSGRQKAGFRGCARRG